MQNYHAYFPSFAAAKNLKVIADDDLISIEWEEAEEMEGLKPVVYWCEGSVLQGKCLVSKTYIYALFMCNYLLCFI